MNAVDNSVDACAICLGALEEEPGRRLYPAFLPAFIQRFLKKEGALTLKPCAHKFHVHCISRWLNESQQCPLDRRLITGSTPPALCSINLHKELLKSVEMNQIEAVRDILSAGLSPEQSPHRAWLNPLTVALKNDRWAIAAQLSRAGWITKDKIALNNLGWMHRNGLGGEQDYAKALFWFHKAAQRRSAAAQCNLGWMYQKGLGVKQDYATASFWYRKAADQGDAIGRNDLGWMYRNGLGVAQDYAKALFWFRKAANQGYATAQNNLGCMYQQGLGTKQDYATALLWFRRAADQGNNMAQNNLAFMYRSGLGCKQDYTEALSWCRKAADQDRDVIFPTFAVYDIGKQECLPFNLRNPAAKLPADQRVHLRILVDGLVDPV